MASNTFTLISSVTVGSGGAASIDFTSIPATYTDLCLKLSLRSTRTSQPVADLRIAFNGSTTSFSIRDLYGTGSAAGSATDTNYLGGIDASTATSNTFANQDLYIPNYAGSANKSFSVDSVSEDNTSGGAYAFLVAGLWSNTAAINQITFTTNSTFSFAQYSTAYLYGIKNS